jgi:lysozyme family protein
MTVDHLIDGILEREGGYVNNPADRGGPTKFGITAATLAEWRRLGRPATAAEVKAMKVEEARAIYTWRYIEPFANIPFDELRAQLIDYGVNSGVDAAKRALQRVLRVPVDGIIGPRTLAALLAQDWRFVNDALVAARVKHFLTIAEDDPTQRQFLFGWMRRAVSFIV